MSEQEVANIYFKKQWHIEDARKLGFLNSALFFGESTFTTMRIKDGNILYREDHLERLLRSLNFLFEDLSDELWQDFQEALIAAGELKRSGYLRATFFRDGEEVVYFLYHREFPTPIHENSAISLTLSQGRKGLSMRPSFLKTGDYLDSHLELAHARAHNFDEVLFLDTQEHILECSTSNIFWVIDNVVYTSESSSSVLEGVMRKNLIETLKGSDWPVIAGHYKVDVLSSASEVWITNALRGLTYISRFESKEYISRHVFDQVVALLLKSTEEKKNEL